MKKQSFLTTGIIALLAAVLMPLMAGADMTLIEWSGAPGTGTTNGLTNLAIGATPFAESSLEDGGNGLIGINDGNLGFPWTAALETIDSFVGVAFAAPETVDKIAFNNHWGAREHGVYVFQYTTIASPDASTPDSSWTNIGVYQEGPGNLNRKVFGFDAVSNITGIRITTATINGLSLTIGELEIYGPGATADPITLIEWGSAAGQGATYGQTNLAPAGTAFAQDEFDGGNAMVNANDGNYRTPWTALVSDSFVGVALAAPTTIDRIALGSYWGHRSVGTYTFQYTTVANPDAATHWTQTGLQ